jgi:phosphoglycerate kinase
MFLTLKDMDFKNKRVLIRADFNVPIEDNRISDDTRIKKAIPSINYVLRKKAKQVILMSHLGRPKARVIDALRLDLVASTLEGLLGKRVNKIGGCVDVFVPDNRIILLENLRFYKGEESNDTNFAKKLSKLGDIYVNDAFGVCHREHASVSAITRFLPSCAGLLLEKEIRAIENITKRPKKPFMMLIGGAKADKIHVINNLVNKADKILLAGVLANTFLKASGVNIGKSKYDKSSVKYAKKIINNKRYKNKIILPVDVVVGDAFSEDAAAKNVDINNISHNLILDIGNKTINNYKNILKKAKTLVWAGAIGVFEWKQFSKATKSMALFLSRSKARTIIGGGDTAYSIHKLGLMQKMWFVSTGGGAFLEALSGKELPGIRALEKSHKHK